MQNPDDLIARARKYLATLPESIEGQKGHDALFRAATVLAHGYAFDDATALDLLREYNATKCSPSWDEKELERKIREAGRRAHDKPKGWLLDGAKPHVPDFKPASPSVKISQPPKTATLADLPPPASPPVVAPSDFLTFADFLFAAFRPDEQVQIETPADLGADGVTPSNVGRGYVLRRLIRRTVMKARLLGVKGGKGEPLLLPQLAAVAAEIAAAAEDSTLPGALARVQAELAREEERFSATLDAGGKLLNDALNALEKNGKGGAAAAGGQLVLPGATAFELYDTFGFPLEVTQEVCADRGATVDVAGFEAAGLEPRKGDLKRLEDRHKRETRRHRTDEFRSGLRLLTIAYGAALQRATEATAHHQTDAYVRAVKRIRDASVALERNVNERLLLENLLLSLPNITV